MVQCAVHTQITGGNTIVKPPKKCYDVTENFHLMAFEWTKKP
ncbi:MAG: hypothetical protein CM15mP122_4450 [Bacteroidota bacterium]|nr:MAG: hypothetical protein CM15mP122_4450 [Bacteroidota bacterium]